MSSFDKVVKLACKPKAAPPKAKYIDPIIAATWSDDGAIHDVCKALAPRIREPNAIVVFKALIVLHTMIRNGATDNVLSYLSQSEVLRLRNVSAGNWEGYVAPQNLQNYALYLESRIRAYKDLKHDAVRVQAESNRDMRNSQSIEEEGYRGRNTKVTASAPARSKTIMGRKLRSMTVEKGLLRETRAVHGMIDALVECRFYLDDLEDELTITALRMLVKDLLILFQAGNEGVINVLENYFEMSRIDAAEALKIYRHFCKQTEHVVEYLGVAKKLQNLINVSIPNLRHAPVSLAGALQEYLDDPNFEQNRIEYKQNKDPTKRGERSESAVRKTNGASSKPSETKDSQPTAKVAFDTKAKETSASYQKKNGNDVQDFFAAIEQEQPTMFNPSTNSPSTAYFQQQGAANPFQQMAMATGQPFMQQGQLMAQPTGFLMPQNTVVPMQQSNPFGSFLGAPVAAQPTGHRPFSSYLPVQQQQPQMTGFPQQQQQPQPTGFGQQQPQQSGLTQQQQTQQIGLSPQQPQQTGFPQQQQQPQQGFMQQQPQQTGFSQQQSQHTGFPQQHLQQQQTGFLRPQTTGGPNPFRQSMLVPQSTGMALFGGTNQAPPLPTQTGMSGSTSLATGLSALSLGQPFSVSSFTSPKPSFATSGSASGPARPASTPLTSVPNRLSSSPQPVKTHVTGTKNPFGPIFTAPPPVPKAPTLFELSTGSFNQNQAQPPQQQSQPAQQPQQVKPQATGFTSFSFNNSTLNPGATDISSVASSFSFANKSKPSFSTPMGTNSPLSPQDTSATNNTSASGSTFSNSLFSSTLSNQATGNTSTFSATDAPVKSHVTGFTGLKPFKPSSSFGASLLESLPPVPGSQPTTPGITGLPATNPTGTNGLFNATPSPANGTNGTTPNNFSFLSSQPTGAMGGFGSSSNIGSSLGVGLRPQMTGGGTANPFRASMAMGALSTGNAPNFGSTSAFQPSAFQPSMSAFNPSQNTGFGSQQQQPQPNATSSLI
ncbi:hypothetical protein D9619_006328 [Psilocybe cf. subviscida]|uniref:ENTH domain-containing protein n=1 Tax=Psilocybe cf. subviscida TaxID=2480587 RepID=A0A8H5B4B9_9AGAR|nr:hypothetical protein D9619_006328 [Psilocybe cf. subviscida]